MTLNTHKCQKIIFGIKYEHVWVKWSKHQICESNNVKLVGVEIDNELKFDEHISNISLTLSCLMS